MESERVKRSISHVLKPEQREEIAERYLAGEWVPELAKAYGVTTGAVQSILLFRKIPQRPSWQPVAGEEWITVQQAANMMGLTKAGVMHHIRSGRFTLNRVPSARPGLPERLLVSVKEIEQAQGQRKPLYRPDYDRKHTVAELAYLAGLFDGEGCVMICKRAGKAQASQYYLSTYIGNTYEGVIDWLYEHFDGVLAHPKRSREDWKPLHVWKPPLRHTGHLLKLMLPYLVIKREQALIAIEFSDHIVEYNASRWKNMDTEEIEWREVRRAQMMALNKRGAKS